MKPDFHKIGVFATVLLAFAAIFTVSATRTNAQEVVDKTVAVVRNGASTELITYSDLMWQLALQPGVSLDKPRSQDLNEALQTLINQRLFTIEAARLPRTAPSDKEIADKISETLAYFPSPAVFEARLKQVGFQSVKDEAFERLIAQRVATEKYVDFRFASFVVVTSDDEAKYYNDTYVPAFRKRSPGVLVPTLDEASPTLHKTLTQQKVAAGIESFLDETKRRAVIDVLIEV